MRTVHDTTLNLSFLPLEIKQRISSYLYFPKEQSNTYKIINYLVTNYSNLIYNALLIQYNHNQIYRSLLRWINKCENEQLYTYIDQYYNINYDINSDHLKEKQNLCIMNEIPFFGLQRFYKSFQTYV